MALFSRDPREHWLKSRFSKNEVAKSGYIKSPSLPAMALAPPAHHVSVPYQSVLLDAAINEYVKKVAVGEVGEGAEVGRETIVDTLVGVRLARQGHVRLALRIAAMLLTPVVH